MKRPKRRGVAIRYVQLALTALLVPLLLYLAAGALMLVLYRTTQGVPVLLTLIALTLYPLGWIGGINQKIRNAQAVNLLRDLVPPRPRKRSPRSATLLLRSFQMDNRFGDPVAINAIRSTAGVTGGLTMLIPGFALIAKNFGDRRMRELQLEHQLARATKMALPSTTLCSIGNLDKTLGFGRITSTNADWKEAAALLIDHSERIIMLFGPGAGTSWELGRLIEAESLLSKTVFIIPPSSSAVALASSGLNIGAGAPQARVNQSLSEQYAILSDRLAEAGYIAPPFKSGIAFGFVNGRPETVNFNKLNGQARKNIKRLLQLLAHEPKLAAPRAA